MNKHKGSDPFAYLNTDATVPPALRAHIVDVSNDYARRFSIHYSRLLSEGKSPRQAESMATMAVQLDRQRGVGAAQEDDGA